MTAPFVYTQTDGIKLHSCYGKPIRGHEGKEIISIEHDNYLGRFYIYLNDGTTLEFSAGQIDYGHGDIGHGVFMEEK